MVVLKNCEPELSYKLAELSNNWLKESCFPDCWKVSRWPLYLRMLGKDLQPKTSTLLVFFLRLVRGRIVDNLEKCGLFSDFQFGLRSSRSTADLLTVVSNTITSAIKSFWQGLACWSSSQT